MNTDTVSVRADVTVEVVLRYLRMRGELPDKTDRLFVVDARRPLSRHRRADAAADRRPGETGRRHPRFRRPRASRRRPTPTKWRGCSRTATSCPRPWSTTHGKLLGRITVDDVVDVIREEAAHEVMSAAGLRDEEDVFAGVFPSTRRRLVWLGINLVTAFLAAAVVSRFEGTIEKVAALAALMPIVASMGGIAGTQTVTLIIRGIALGQVEWVNAKLAAVEGNRGRRAQRPHLGRHRRRRHHRLVRHLEDRRHHRRRDADQPAGRRRRRRDRAAAAAAHAHRSGAVGRRDPHDVHRLHRLRHFVRPRRAVPDLAGAAPADRAGSSGGDARHAAVQHHAPVDRRLAAHRERQQVLGRQLRLPEAPRIRGVVRRA